MTNGESAQETKMAGRQPMMARMVLLSVAAVVAAWPAAAFAQDVDVSGQLASQGLLVTLLSMYLAGVGVSLTPCLYPMIPVTLGVIGARIEGANPWQGFLRAGVFVLGIATVYTMLGLVTTKLFGTGIQAVLQLWWVWVLFFAFFVAMGLSMMGLFTIQIPPALAAKLQGGTAGRGGYVGAFAVGLVTGVAASPCGSPWLASLIVFAAQKGNVAAGGALFFAYALGMGSIFLVLGAFPALLSRMPRSGGWMEDVKRGLGLVLIGVGVWYLGNAVPAAAGWARGAYTVAVVVGLLGAAAMVAVGSMGRRHHKTLLRAWQATALVLAVGAVWVAFTVLPGSVFAARKPGPAPVAPVAAATATATPAAKPAVSTVDVMGDAKAALTDETKFAALSGTAAALSPAAASPAAASPSAAGESAWLTDEPTALAEAKKRGVPVIIDFGATWCAACKELEEETFPDPKVAEALKGFVKLKIDCTEANPVSDALQKKYGALSLPTVAFVGADGERRPKLDLKTFEKPAKFVERLGKVAAK